MLRVNRLAHIWNLLLSLVKGPGQPQPVARSLTAPTYLLKSVAHGSWRPGADLRRFRLAVTLAGLGAEMGDARHTKKTFVTATPWRLLVKSIAKTDVCCTWLHPSLSKCNFQMKTVKSIENLRRLSLTGATNLGRSAFSTYNAGVRPLQLVV